MQNNVVELPRPIKPLAQLPVARGDSKHSRYINILAKMAACVEPVAQARIAACIVYRNDIVSFGICKMKSHPFQARFGKNKDSIFLHAENDCIKNALKLLSIDELSRCSLYVCRVKYEDRLMKKLLFGLAKPCSGCSRCIANFSISKVYYSLDNEGFSTL